MKIAVQLEDGRNLLTTDSDRVGRLLLAVFNNVDLITQHNPVTLTLNCKGATVRPILELHLPVIDNKAEL